MDECVLAGVDSLLDLPPGVSILQIATNDRNYRNVSMVAENVDGQQLAIYYERPAETLWAEIVDL